MTHPVALITGASRGLGHAMVRAFKAEGYRVVACSRSSTPHPEADLWVTCDVTRPDSCRDAVAQTVAAFGSITTLVNNAGLAGNNPMDADASDELWHAIIATNLHGPYYLIKAALPHISDQTGSIVNIGSVLSLMGVPDQPAYCAAKHGLLGLTRAIGKLVAPRNITVNCICPGWIDTEMAGERLREIGISKAQATADVPLQRFLSATEVAANAVFLAGPNARGITGQAWTIDCGVLS